jgi:hypothetical protein
LDYQQRLDAELMPDLLSARRWLRVYVWLPRACYSLPGRLPFFWQAVCRIIRGERRYTDIRRRLGLFGFVENLLPDPVAASRLAAR